MDRLDDNDNEQLFPSMGDNTTSTTRTKQINSQIQEVTIERTRTLTYGIEDNTVRAEESCLCNNPETTAPHRLYTEIHCWISHYARGDMPDPIQQGSAEGKNL